MAISDSPVPMPAPSITVDPDRLYELLERLLAAQERTLVALDRLTPPPASTRPTGTTGRPPLRVLQGGGGR
jgi:hypothetical protein